MHIERELYNWIILLPKNNQTLNKVSSQPPVTDKVTDFLFRNYGWYKTKQNKTKRNKHKWPYLADRLTPCLSKNMACNESCTSHRRPKLTTWKIPLKKPPVSIPPQNQSRDLAESYPIHSLPNSFLHRSLRSFICEFALAFEIRIGSAN